MPKVTPQEMAGRELAVEMIRALAVDWKAVKIPPSTPDDAVSEFMVSREPATFRSYFAKVSGDAARERGFFCVLSDYIGAEVNDCPGFRFEQHYLGKRGE